MQNTALSIETADRSYIRFGEDEIKSIIPIRYFDPAAVKEAASAVQRVHYLGNVTIVTLTHGIPGTAHTGATVAGYAKRNPTCDEYKRDFGVQLAFIRAYQMLLEHGW